MIFKLTQQLEKRETNELNKAIWDAVSLNGPQLRRQLHNAGFICHQLSARCHSGIPPQAPFVCVNAGGLHSALSSPHPTSPMPLPPDRTTAYFIQCAPPLHLICHFASAALRLSWTACQSSGQLMVKDRQVSDPPNNWRTRGGSLDCLDKWACGGWATLAHGAK